MRKERLSYRDLLRRLLAGRSLRLEERRRAEDALAIPDDLEVAVRLSAVLDGMAERGALVRLGRQPADRPNVQRYLDSVTNDYWTIEAPGPAAVHPSEEHAAAAAPRPPARVPAEPRIVLPIEELDLSPALPARFRDPESGEPQRTLFTSFAPCRTTEELVEALAPIRDHILRLTSATDVRFHVMLGDDPEPTLIPIREEHSGPMPSLGGKAHEAVVERRRALHVPNLRARGTGAEDGESGALVLVPLVSGVRWAGVMEISRGEPGPFDEDELAFLALCAESAAGTVVRAEELEKLIFLDRLTGLYNRAYFDDQIEREIERANRMGTSVALLMADLDHFKRINDTRGHQAGDRALAHVAAIIRSNFRQVDVAARYGGEEFAILLPAITRSRCARTAERLRRVVADSLPGETIPELDKVRLSISIGFALYPDDAATAKQLIERADRVALYAAKNNGRNRVVPWSAARDQRARVRSDT